MTPDVLYKTPPDIDKTIEIIHTPGHTRGSICLLEKITKSLFSGDTIYGNQKGEIRDFIEEKDGSERDLKLRLKSATKLLEYDFENVYPFHYEAIERTAKDSLLRYTIKYN